MHTMKVLYVHMFREAEVGWGAELQRITSDLRWGSASNFG